MSDIRRLRSAVLLGTALLVVVLVPRAAPAAESRDLFERAAALARAELEADGVGGLSLGIVSASDLVFAAGFGLADMERNVEARADHVYRIGSITKPFTAYAFLRLEREGALELTDPVARHVPEIARVANPFPDAPGPTLLQLATMTSGLAREPEELETFLVGPASEWLDVALSALPRVRFDFPPDTRYQYSNIGYAILGASLQRASGREYMDYVREKILTPLGMADTDFVPRDRFRDRIATGYVVRDGEIDAETPAREHEGRGYKVPNGALYSTVADLARFLSFQLGHGPERLLPHEDLAANFDRLNSADGSLTTGYGIGFQARRRGTLVVYGHGGSVAGYRAGAYFDRESGIGVVVLRNVTGGSLDVTELAMRILVWARAP